MLTQRATLRQRLKSHSCGSAAEVSHAAVSDCDNYDYTMRNSEASATSFALWSSESDMVDIDVASLRVIHRDNAHRDNAGPTNHRYADCVLHYPNMESPLGSIYTSASPLEPIESPPALIEGPTESGFKKHEPQLWPLWLETLGENEAARSTDGQELSRHTSEIGFNGRPSTGSILRAGDELLDNSCMQRFVVRPSSYKRMGWDLTSFLIMGYDVIFLPLQAFPVKKTTYVSVMDWVTIGFWSCDMVFSLTIGYHDGGLTELRPSKVVWRYLKTWFMLDFIIVFIDWLLMFALSGGSADVFGIVRIGKALRILRVLRMFRLLRVLKVMTIITEFSDLIHSQSLLTGFSITKLVVGVAVINHFIACIWYALGVADWTGSSASWVLELEGATGHGVSVGYAYTSALHWSLTQFMPASMEVVPVNVAERIFAIVVIVFAMVSFSSFVSSISSAMTHLRSINLEYLRQREYVRRYITENKVPLELGNRIYSYVRQHGQSQRKRVHETDVAAFGGMPDSLRIDLHTEVYSPLLTQHPFFYYLNTIDVETVKSICHTAMSESSLLIKGSLFTGGQKAEYMYFVRGGNLEYFRNNHHRANKLRADDYLCEMVLWFKWEHRGRLVATAQSELVNMNAEAFRVAVSKSVEFQKCRSYAHLYAKAVVDANSNCVEDRLSDVWGHSDITQEISEQAFEFVATHVGHVASMSSLSRRLRLDMVRKLSIGSHGSSGHSGTVGILERIRRYLANLS